ncbi:MAG: glycosyltransferase [Planctomycetota bacterium]|jgi:glycosyltransferase involved in cell wall biosynthesis
MFANPARHTPWAPRPIRVARIITRLNIGGPARHVAALAGLDRLGFATTLIAGAEGEREGSLRELSVEAGLQPELCPGLGRRISPGSDARALLGLIQRLRACRPHIVHTHTAKAGALGRVAARLAGVPHVIHTFHGHVFEGYFSKEVSEAVRITERALSCLTSRVIAISPRIARDITRKFRVCPSSRVRCIPLGLDLEPFADLSDRRGALRDELGLSASAPLLGWVGRVAPIKRPLFMLRAFERVLATRNDAHLVFVGDGPLLPEVTRAILARGLERRVHALGFRKDLRTIYADLDVFCLTSANEGTPVALIEALSAGIPAVATRVGGVPDVTEGSEATLVDPHSSSAFGDALLSWLSLDPTERSRRGELGRPTANRFRVDALCENMAALYRSLLRGPRLR